MRSEVHQLVRKYTVGFAVAVMQCSTSVAIERNDARLPHQQVPRTVIERMAARIELPDPIKRPWEKWSAVLDSESVALEELLPTLWKLVEDAGANPTKPVVLADLEAIAAAKAATAKSVVHRFDTMSRKHLAELMKSVKASGR